MHSVEPLLQAMGQCRALDAGQVEAARRELLPRFGRDPRGLSAELLKRGWLTPFQINHLAVGRGQELLQGSYVLMERLGEGGMGQVYKARAWKLDRVVALKVIRKELSANPTVVGRFRREIEATAQLDHPHLIRAYDAGETDDGRLYIAMEYVAGIDLGRRVRNGGPVTPAQACRWTRQAALGLQHAHERGLVHRDIKPGNLLLADAGDSIKILDLGLARLQDQTQRLLDNAKPALTLLGVIVGTVDFIAPEQARDSRRVDIRADLYSLGCTFCYLLTGQPPFNGRTSTEKLMQHWSAPLPPLPALPKLVRAVIHNLMAKQPAERCQTPAELVAALDFLLEHPQHLEPACAAPLPVTVPMMALPASPAVVAAPPAPTKPKLRRLSAARPKLPAKPTLAAAVLEATPRPRPAPMLTAPIPVLPPARRPARWRYVVLAVPVLASLLLWPLFVPPAETRAEPQAERAADPKPVVEVAAREFLVVGPFGRSSRLPALVEANPDPEATYADRFSLAHSWRVVPADADGALRLSPGFVQRPAVLYVMAHVHSPDAHPATLLTGSADALRIWVNGQEVLDSLSVRPQPKPDEDRTPIALKPGRNTILTRLGAQGQRPFEFWLSVRSTEELHLSTRAK